MLRSDLDRERRGKQGVENLAKALQETPNFGGEDSQQDVNDKLLHVRLNHVRFIFVNWEISKLYNFIVGLIGLE